MFYFYLFIWLHHVFVATCRPFFALHTWDLRFPWPGIRPASPALEGRVLNHWTTREVPTYLLLRNWIPKWRCPIAIKSQETEREKRSGPEMQSWRSVGHKKGHQEVQFIFIHIHIQVFTPLSFFFFFSFLLKHIFLGWENTTSVLSEVHTHRSKFGLEKSS